MISKLLLTVLVMGLMDAFWLSVARNFFREQIGHLMNIQKGELVFSLGGAAVAYIAMIASLMFFIYPVVGNDVFKAAWMGAILGVCMFGVYEGTSMAVLRDWTWKMVIADMLWGAILFAVTASVVTYVSSRFFA